MSQARQYSRSRPNGSNRTGSVPLREDEVLNYRGAVKNIALAVGFKEFGRFSAEYLQLFGETPSATLTKNV